MKKLIALLLALVMVMALAACSAPTEKEETKENKETKPTTEATEDATEEPTEEPTVEATEDATEPFEDTKSEGVMTYEEYVAAEMDAEVVVECYVQAHQSWWDDKITVYAQDADGAYFLYEMACAEVDKDKLTEGTKIRVTGYKGQWAGEIEIMDATFEIVEDAPTFVAEPLDVTELLDDENLIDYQNQKIAVNGATVKAIEFKNGEPGDDIYVTLTVGEKDYSFCVEMYLTAPETDVYKAAAELKAGDKVNVEGFLYWYEGPNPHITAIEKI